MAAQILALLELDENSRRVVESLERSGHVVEVAETFTKAMFILQTPHQIDLIISDVHLENGGNVFDFLRWMKKNPATHEALFVMFSCEPTATAKYLEDGIRTSARMLGVAKYITMESFDADEFRKQIDSLLPIGEQAAELSPHRKR